MAAAKATIWSFLSVLTGAGLQLALILYLTKTLTDAQVGLIFLSLSLIYLSQMLQDSGLSVVLLRRLHLTRTFWRICQWQALLQGVAVAALLLTLAPLLSYIYSTTALSDQILLIALLQLVNSLSLCGQTQLIRQQQLPQLAQIEIVAKLAGAALVWPLLTGSAFDMQLLIWGLILSALVKAAFIRSRLPCWPAVAPTRWSRSAFIWRQAFQLNTTQLAALIRSQFDTFIVGKWFGLETLAVYGLAREMVQGPLKILQPVIQRLCQAKWSGAALSSPQQLLPAINNTLFSTTICYVLLLLCLPLLLQWFGLAQQPDFILLVLALAFFGTVRPLGQIGVLYAELHNNLQLLLRWALLSTLFWCGALTIAASLVALTGSTILWFGLALCVLQLLTTIAALYFIAGVHPARLPRLSLIIPLLLAAAAGVGHSLTNTLQL